jgi:Zn-dependent protease with chaperone function
MPTLAPAQPPRPKDRAPLDEKALIAQLQARIDPVRTSLFYKFGLLVVAITMLVLPLIYVALVAGAGYCVFWYATHGAAMFRTIRSPRAVAFAYLAPLAVGGLVLVFMLKPLFPRRRDRKETVSLKLLDEPLLHTFVYKLCDLLRAPRPCRIDVNCQVNASASFRGGLLGFIRRDLVLTIGLPLVGGLNLRQFAGVLAHELGHFAQGGGMRLTYVIRMVSFWFARVVYERDSFDDWLIGACSGESHGAVVLVAWLARLFVWITRRVLWVLMFVGHAISTMMLRQMEFDADRYEVRVAGTDTFLQTIERLAALSVASQAAFADVNTAWQERRLCDDLPTLICSRERDLTDDIRIAINKAASSDKTGWFDSHPSNAQRKESARRENARGVFRSELPATVLFHDLARAARMATIGLYREELGRQFSGQNIVPTDSLIEHRGQQKQTHDSLRRYFQGLIDPRRPVFPATAHINPNKTKLTEHVAAEALLDARSQFLGALPAAQQAAKRFGEADTNASMAGAVKALRMAGLKKIQCPDERYLKIDEATLRAMEKQGATERSEAARSVDEVLAPALLRLEMALFIDALRQKTATDARDAGTDDGDEMYALTDDALDSSVEKKLVALTALRAAAPRIEALRAEVFVMGALLAHCQPHDNPEMLVSAVVCKARAMSEQLRALHAQVRDVKYPYEHAERNVSLAGFLARHLPTPEEIGQVQTIADGAVDAFYGLYMRMMADLASRAEEIESSLGLPQLEAPKDD